MKCDLRKEEEILAMFELIKKEYGGVDVCINNAGCTVGPDSILNGSTDSWRTQFDVCFYMTMTLLHEQDMYEGLQ